MTVQDHLRTLLESNKSVFLSGEEIARRLGVSRNAVWKATPFRLSRTAVIASPLPAMCSPRAASGNISPRMRNRSI